MRIFIARYGLDGRGTRSVDAAARELAVSRGDVRELEGRVLQLLRKIAS